MNSNPIRKFAVTSISVLLVSMFVYNIVLSDNKAKKQSPHIKLENWLFCEGDIPTPDVALCQASEKPKSISPHNNIGMTGKPFTYFAQYKIDEALNDQVYAINLGPVGDQDHVWVDGKFVGQTHYAEHLAVGFQGWKNHELDPEMVTPGVHDVRIKVDYAGPMFGGILGNPEISTNKYAQISNHRYSFYRSYFPFACSIALVFLSLYSGLVGVFGRNKSFFYDYMGFGICFSLYIGSIGFVYSYIGFDWLNTLILFSASIIGALYFSLRLIFQLDRWSDQTRQLYLRASDIFVVSLSVIYIAMFTSGWHVFCVLLLQTLLVTLVILFSYYSTKYSIQLFKKNPTFYHIVCAMVGPIFYSSITIDLYKQFFDAGSFFYSPYALIAVGFFVMLLLAQQHVTALRDQEMKNELEIKNQKLKYLSEHDPLTALYNRRTFESLIEYNINSANENKGYALLILDIDHFKAYNDSYGHPAGDRLLITFSKVLKDAVRLSDYVGRLGGEEFGIFLHNVNFEQAENICEHIRESIEKATFENLQKTGKHVTASIGALHFSRDINKVTYPIAYKVADRCLYKAKEKRNTVVLKKALAMEISSEITPMAAST